jgi:hypothetical protein
VGGGGGARINSSRDWWVGSLWRVNTIKATHTHTHIKGGFQRDFRSAIFQDFSFIFFIEGYYFLAKRFGIFSSASFTPNEPPPS